MPTVDAMIPVLLGSTRVPDKNIILVDGRVLCSYTIEACRNSGAFSEIYLNSEDAVFESIAKQEGAKFHRRPADFGGRACRQKTKSRDCAGKRCVINEHYLYNFMTTGSNADYVCQVNSTSPLLKPETIRAFVDALTSRGYDTFFATQQVRAETFYRGEAITFSRKRKQPSNELEPLEVICWAIAGWRREAFIASYERDELNENGPVFGGNCGVFPIDEREALDIDGWSTLDVVESFLVARRENRRPQRRYIDGRPVPRAD
jgi:CMP-N-acetylneuraminic acid synthetase